MKVVDTFLFSEPYEAEVLLVKFHVQNAGVDEFVGIECDYTFRGEQKGHHLQALLDTDERFAPFRNKTRVLTINDNLFEKLCDKHGEKDYFKVEHASRAACFEYIDAKYEDDDRILLSDADEMLDFNDARRYNALMELFNTRTQESLDIQNFKFWYDFDNLCYWPDKFIATHSLKHLRDDRAQFDNKNGGCQQCRCAIPLAFEYAYCFPFEDNWKKLNSFAHDNYTREALEKGLKFNHWHREPARGERLGQTIYDFFETVKLNDDNSPKYVRDNLDTLKLNNIPEHYRYNRFMEYGINWNPMVEHIFRGQR